MAFQIGTYTDGANLRNTAAIFGASNGWTVNKNDSSHLALQKGSLYFNFGSDMRIQGSTGFDGGLAWDNQPGSTSFDVYGSMFTPSGETYSANLEKSGGSYFMAIHGDTFAIMAEGQRQWSQLIFGATKHGIAGYTCTFGGGTGRFIGSQSGVPLDELQAPGCMLSVASMQPNIGTTVGCGSRASFLVDGVWTKLGDLSSGSLSSPIYSNSFSISDYPEQQFIGLSGPLVNVSGGEYRGNVPLTPTYFMKVYSATVEDSLANVRFIGDFDGVKLINALEFKNGDPVFNGSDEYFLSKINEISQVDNYGKNKYAIAVLKA